MTMEDSSEPMTAAAAAQTLRDLEHYEEALTVRAFGITLMVFGLGAPAINMAYHIGNDWTFLQENPWWFSFLWLPWILGAQLITMALWKAQAITFGRTYDSAGDWKLGAGFGFLYMALYGALTAYNYFLGPRYDPAVVNMFVVALFSALLAAFWHKTQEAARAHTVTQLLAAFALLAMGVVSAAMRLEDETATFVVTLGTMAAWLTAGWLIQRRG